MDRYLWSLLFFVLVFLVVVSVFVWNIILVSRSVVSMERNASMVQESIIDGIHADKQENASLAAITTQRATTRLDTLSSLVGGNAQLGRSTGVDIDKLHGLLTEQMHQIIAFLPDVDKHPLLDVNNDVD